MTNSRSSNKESPGPLKTITLGRNPKTAVIVNFYPASKGRFVAILYDTAGTRVKIERGSLACAEEDARDHVSKHISPETIEKKLVESQAARLVAPTDLLVACAEYAEATKLLQPVKASILTQSAISQRANTRIRRLSRRPLRLRTTWRGSAAARRLKKQTPPTWGDSKKIGVRNSSLKSTMAQVALKELERTTKKVK